MGRTEITVDGSVYSCDVHFDYDFSTMSGSVSVASYGTDQSLKLLTYGGEFEGDWHSLGSAENGQNLYF